MPSLTDEQLDEIAQDILYNEQVLIQFAQRMGDEYRRKGCSYGFYFQVWKSFDNRLSQENILFQKFYHKIYLRRIKL